jgi:hypothetical protein
VGLLGLAAILLLIALASAIMQHARQSEDAATLANGGVSARSAVVRPTAGPGDPLADMGVAPEMRAGRSPGAAASTPATRNVGQTGPQDPARAPRTP